MIVKPNRDAGDSPGPPKVFCSNRFIRKYCYTYKTGLYFCKDACAVPCLSMIDDIVGLSSCTEKSIVLNSIVNSKIESKKLQFNLKKCFNMHVGPKKEDCPQLKIHDSLMKTTETQKYLGEIISSSGKNSENIKERCKTGYKSISEIKSLIKEVSFGKFEIQIGLIMKDSIFMSKMLLNSEVWHSVTKSQIEELEVIDRILLRYILNGHSKTGLEWLYADTGKLNLSSLIQIRRQMYLWHILSRDESELIHRIYKMQKISSSVGDWVTIIESDKLELNIDLTDEEIQGVPKNVFKKYVKSKVKIKHLNYLNNLKKGHSKSEYLNCTELQTAEYLLNQRFSKTEKQLLFRLRRKTLDVKQNSKNVHKNPWCTSCKLFPETQSHLLQCPA